MNLAELSVKRPIFISCIVLLMLAVGLLSLKRLPIDLFPDVTFPVVAVAVAYPGAGPQEVETLVARPIEDELSTLPGLKSLRSINKEGLAQIIVEFELSRDIKDAEQQTRDRIASARRKLPDDIEEPIFRRVDPADQPILVLAVSADLPPAKLFDLTDEFIRPKVEQVPQVGLVDIIGGRKREIRVELDRERLFQREISATQVAAAIKASGQDVPAGQYSDARDQKIYRTLGQFRTVPEIGSTIVSFLGNDVPITVADVGQVVDGLTEERSRSTVNGKPALTLQVFRQSGANTVAVAAAVEQRMERLNRELGALPGQPRIALVQDGAQRIRANLADVQESILIGIILTILVVYLFLGSARSTFITGLALPNSLIGAFILMSVAGFSLNIMSLLALSLAVGLLIDDAIVVRENIFRHLEAGKTPREAAIVGTREVALAVVATTFTVIAVFGPIAFLSGVVGQFFKEFGLTICFAMAISLFDALTIAPMLSAYFAGRLHAAPGAIAAAPGRLARLLARPRRWNRVTLRSFDRFQGWLEDRYERALEGSLRRPKLVLAGALGIFLLSVFLVRYIPKTFVPAQDNGELAVNLDLAPGTSLSAMAAVANEVDLAIREEREVETSVLTVGGRDGEANVSQFFVKLVPSRARPGVSTSLFKDRLRQKLKRFSHARPIVRDPDTGFGGGQRPFSLNIVGVDLAQLEREAGRVFAALRAHPSLKDVDSTFRSGKPEFQVVLDNRRAEEAGVSTVQLGQELRTQIEGAVPAVFRENGREYDIRVRLREDQRKLEESFARTSVPNINRALIRLPGIARPVSTVGPATIRRLDRARYIAILADVAPSGPGLGKAIEDAKHLLTEGDAKLPEGMRYSFGGQAENFTELGQSMALASLLGILFIYLVLASLYESFITPITIMLVLPLAACGAFLALFVTRQSLDIFSMIGCIMLLGIATKNSILLVDATLQLMRQGVAREEAIRRAGRLRLRPILMTTIALVAGMLPVAIGLNEASKQRTSMGIAIIGGLISSTFLTLVVVPAAFSYIDRFRIWAEALFMRISGEGDDGADAALAPGGAE